jgi:hypothetical protein
MSVKCEKACFVHHVRRERLLAIDVLKSSINSKSQLMRTIQLWIKFVRSVQLHAIPRQALVGLNTQYFWHVIIQKNC